MKIMHNGLWEGEFPPYYSNDKEVRIKVLNWAIVSPIDDLYFIPKRQLRTILNYLQTIGVKEVLKKIKSRRAEHRRNNKFFSVGLGIIHEEKKYVAFFAPCHPMCADEIVLPTALTAPLKYIKEMREESLCFYNTIFNKENIPKVFQELAGWSIYSGKDLKAYADIIQTELLVFLEKINWKEGKLFNLENEITKIKNYTSKRYKNSNSSKLTAAIIGYGQYAKTNIIPNVKKYIDIKKIYEVDPTQMNLKEKNIQWSSSPFPDETDNFDIYFIAGYHHTHSPIAEHVIKKGAVAVVEKPVVVDSTQLESLLKIVSEFQGSIYSCYQKRFSPFNQLVFNDLGVHIVGDPINYHCIVHEVPLPKKHWYSWPNSHTRIVSNGCHWIDHFLYLNDYSKPVFIDGFISDDETVNSTIQLENGALFTMVLTDRGSSRIGVQDYVELRKAGVTVKIENGSKYFSENTHKVIRQIKIKKLQSHVSMYNTIAKDIKYGNYCDSFKSLSINNATMIELENHLINNKSLQKNISHQKIFYN